MKLKTISSLLALAALSTLNSQISTIRAQGSLTPPAGAPAPVMKSLDQIEARTPVESLSGDATAKYIISQPGSYYLTTNLVGVSGKAGIRIEATHVVLDLNGFSLQGVSGGTEGIRIAVNGGPVSIRNGTLNSWTTAGIFGGDTATHVSLTDLAITDISAGPGVYVGNHSTAKRISVNGAQRAGIYAGDHLGGGVVDHCTVENFGIASAPLLPDLTDVMAIGASLVSDSTVRGVTNNGLADFVNGISADSVERCRVSDFALAGTFGAGIAGGLIRNCVVQNITGTEADVYGIYGNNIECNIVIDANGAAQIGIISGGYNARIAGNTLTRCKISASSSTEVTGNRVAVGNNQVAVEANYGGSRISGNTIIAGTGSTARGIQLNGIGNFVEHNLVSIGSSACGIYAQNSKNTIRDNCVHGDTASIGISIAATVTGCRVDGNSVTVGTSGTGILTGAGAVNNVVIRNTVSGTAIPYNVIAGNQIGTLVSSDTLDATVSPWANLSQP